MRFSVATFSARRSQTVCRLAAIRSHLLPPLSISVHRLHPPLPCLASSHSSSVPAILVARCLARSRSSRPAQVPLLIVVSPASLCCLLCLPLPFCYAYVRLNAINNTQPSGGCSACDGRSTRHSHGRAAARVDRPKHLSCHVCAWIACMTVTHSHPIIDSRAEWTQ